MQTSKSPVLQDLDKSITPNRYVTPQVTLAVDLVVGIK